MGALVGNCKPGVKLPLERANGPHLNANYRHLCSPSTPVTAELFGDDLPKVQKVVNDTLFGTERTNMEVLTIQLTSSQKTLRASSTSEESRRGRRRVTKLNPHTGQSHDTKICWVSQQMRIYWTLYSIATLRLAIQINQGQGLKFSLILKKKQSLMQKLLTCLNWV